MAVWWRERSWTSASHSDHTVACCRMLAGHIVMLGRMRGKLEMSTCVIVCKVETHTTVWISLPSTNAVSLVSGLLRSSYARSREALRIQGLQEDHRRQEILRAQSCTER